MFTTFLIAQADNAAKTPQNSQFSWQMWLMLLMGLAAYWLLFLRPHNKKRKETQDLLKNLSKGDKVVTIGGIHGKVSSVKEGVVVIKIDDKSELTLDKSAVSKVVSSKNQTEKEKEDTSDDKLKTEIIDEKK